MSNRVYDVLKYIAQIVLPALGTLYFTLAGIWNLPAAEQVVGTIVAVDTFLGVVLKLSSVAYAKSEKRFDGSIHVQETPEKKLFSLELKSDPNEIDHKDQLLFKVEKT